MSANTCLNNQPQYETYEWDNVWLDHAEDLSRRRVLYIGDSISCGSRHIATGQTCEEILFDGFGTSKALDNPYFKDPSLRRPGIPAVSRSVQQRPSRLPPG